MVLATCHDSLVATLLERAGFDPCEATPRTYQLPVELGESETIARCVAAVRMLDACQFRVDVDPGLLARSDGRGPAASMSTLATIAEQIARHGTPRDADALAHVLLDADHGLLTRVREHVATLASWHDDRDGHHLRAHARIERATHMMDLALEDPPARRTTRSHHAPPRFDAALARTAAMRAAPATTAGPKTPYDLASHDPHPRPGR
jgi:hypothetical protein